MRHVWTICGVMLILTGCGHSFDAREDSRVRPASVAKQIGTAIGSSEGASEEAAISSVHLQRKIIYDAEVSLVVKEFSTVEKEIPKLVKQFGGYLADVNVKRTQGAQRSGRWQARIPVDQYDSFLDSVSELGMPENCRQQAQDVTDEYVDLEARIANKKRLEERIVELLNNASDKIKDVIEVERELARVRGEIEQMEGRLRYLTNRTELTTVTVSAREVRDYVPPKAPGFGDRVGQSWGDSLLSLQHFGENVAIVVVYVFPWLLVFVILLTPLVWYVRRRRTK